jgi:hypothetical protein
LEGASIYIQGEVKKFYQKNDGFNRPFWDPKMVEIKEKFYFSKVLPKNKPGGVLHDLVRYGISHFKASHRFFLWGDHFMGYGNRRKADQFWKPV